MDIQINKFTGPLDLLLQLIKQEEMDILDIDIHKITEQYLNFIEKHSIPDLDSAGHFIRMAALLIYMKSKSLFPSESQMNADLEEEDTIQEKLIQSLLKMQAVQNVCQKFRQYPLLNRDIWVYGGGKDLSALFPESKKEDIKQQPIMELMKTHQRVFERSESRRSPSFSTEDSLPVLTDCIRSLHHRFVKGSVLRMSSLIKQKDKNILSWTLVTFLALLELGRLGVVSLEQEGDFDDIVVSVKKQLSGKDFGSIQEMNEAQL